MVEHAPAIKAPHSSSYNAAFISCLFLYLSRLYSIPLTLILLSTFYVQTTVEIKVEIEPLEPSRYNAVLAA